MYMDIHIHIYIYIYIYIYMYTYLSHSTAHYLTPSLPQYLTLSLSLSPSLSLARCTQYPNMIVHVTNPPSNQHAVPRSLLERGCYHWVAILVQRYLSNVASFVLCIVCRAKDHHLYYTSVVRQVVPPDISVDKVLGS